MAWYDLTTEQQQALYHWPTLDAAEVSELKALVNDVKTQLPLAIVALGGTDPGPILGAVLGGSLAQGTASVFSDYDVFIFMQNQGSVINKDDPAIAKNAFGHLLQYRQKLYDLPRRVNVFIGPFGQFYDRNGNDVFGYDLETDALYTTLAECRNAYN